MKKQGVSRDFVTVKFNELYMLKWKGQGKTAMDFVRAIKEIMPEAKCDYKYVSKWSNGYMSPVKYLPAICTVLDVDISEFSPKTHDEKYQYSSDYANGLEGRLEEIAEQNFGIDLTFFQGLRNIVPNFDSTFPKYAPLHYYGINAYAPDGRQRNVYERRVPQETTETKSGKGLFQITMDGQTVFLTKYDMKFIRSLQNRISKLVSVYFEDHQKTIDKAETEANVRFWELIKEINPEFDQDHVIWTEDRLSEEDLQAIDKSGIYTEKEERKFRLPRHGTPLFDDSTETEG